MATQWYFQSRRKISPFFALFPPRIISTEYLREVVGDAFNQVLVLYEDGCYQFFMDAPSQERIGALLFERVRREPTYVRKLTAEVEERGRKLLAVARRFLDGDLESRPLSALRRIFHRYREAYNAMFARGVVAVLIDRPLIAHLQGVLAKRIPNDSERFAEVFTMLSTSSEVNWHLKEDEQLAAIARRARKTAPFARALASGSLTVEGIASFPEIQSALARHHERFGWLVHDYEGDSWTFADIVDRFIEHARFSGSWPASVRTRVKTITDTQGSILGRFSISAQDAALFESLRHCVYLKHFRKNFDVRACLGLDRFFENLSARTMLGREALLALSPEEVESLLDGAAYSTEELLARRKKSAYLTEGGKVQVFTGDASEPWFAEASVERELPAEGMVRGLTASPGRATGPARIVLDAAGLKKILVGDVMVVMDVLPEYLSVLRRCHALVADGGATITSHVATIAREVGLPTLVGALNASRIFTDGMPIEVNATEGYARVIQ